MASREDHQVGEMPNSQQPSQTPARKRKAVLSPELQEVLQMLKSLEAKPAQG